MYITTPLMEGGSITIICKTKTFNIKFFFIARFGNVMNILTDLYCDIYTMSYPLSTFLDT